MWRVAYALLLCADFIYIVPLGSATGINLGYMLDVFSHSGTVYCEQVKVRLVVQGVYADNPSELAFRFISETLV